MKKLHFIIIITFFTIFLSCKKNEVEPTPEKFTTSSITFFQPPLVGNINQNIRFQAYILVPTPCDVNRNTRIIEERQGYFITLKGQYGESKDPNRPCVTMIDVAPKEYIFKPDAAGTYQFRLLVNPLTNEYKTYEIAVQ